MKRPNRKFDRKAVFDEVDKSNIRMSKMSRAERKKLGDAVRKSRVADMEPVLNVSISRRMEDDLKKLVATGLYGVSKSDAARRLLEQGIMKEQWLICPNAEFRRAGPEPSE